MDVSHGIGLLSCLIFILLFFQYCLIFADIWTNDMFDFIPAQYRNKSGSYITTKKQLMLYLIPFVPYIILLLSSRKLVRLFIVKLKDSVNHFISNIKTLN